MLLKYLKKKKSLRLIDASNLNILNIDNFISNFSSILIQSPDIKKFTKNDFKNCFKKKNPHWIN